MGRSYNQGFVYIFQNKDNPNHYMIFEHGEKCDWYDRFTRQGRYTLEHLSEDARANGLDFGYPKFNVKPPIRIEIEDYSIAWLFISYIRENYFKEFIPSTDGGANPNVWSWYIYDGIIEPEKWLNDFYDLQKQRKQELQKTNGIGQQITLF
jgi:hypothetical protein